MFIGCWKAKREMEIDEATDDCSLDRTFLYHTIHVQFPTELLSLQRVSELLHSIQNINAQSWILYYAHSSIFYTIYRCKARDFSTTNSFLSFRFWTEFVISTSLSCLFIAYFQGTVNSI